MADTHPTKPRHKIRPTTYAPVAGIVGLTASHCHKLARGQEKNTVDPTDSTLGTPQKRPVGGRASILHYATIDRITYPLRGRYDCGHIWSVLRPANDQSGLYSRTHPATGRRPGLEYLLGTGLFLHLTATYTSRDFIIPL